MSSSENPICLTCGTQFDAGSPAACPICEDSRQFVGWNGQQWTTLEELQQRFKNVIVEEAPRLTSIHTEPHFAIGQRAFLLEAAIGNVLWDCIPLFDEETVAAVRARGGIAAIAISHPHYYSTMVEWSRAFGDAPIYLHEDDQQWVMRHDGNVQFWRGATRELFDGITL